VPSGLDALRALVDSSIRQTDHLKQEQDGPSLGSSRRDKILWRQLWDAATEVQGHLSGQPLDEASRAVTSMVNHLTTASLRLSWFADPGLRVKAINDTICYVVFDANVASTPAQAAWNNWWDSRTISPTEQLDRFERTERGEPTTDPDAVWERFRQLEHQERVWREAWAAGQVPKREPLTADWSTRANPRVTQAGMSSSEHRRRRPCVSDRCANCRSGERHRADRPAGRRTKCTSRLSCANPVRQADVRHLGQKMCISCIALGTGGRMPLSIPRRRQRVDREDLIASHPQRRYPWTAVGLDPNHHLGGSLIIRQVLPGRRGMFSDQCMQSRDALQTFRQSGPGQATTIVTDDLYAVTILSPVVSDEQQPHPAPFE